MRSLYLLLPLFVLQSCLAQPANQIPANKDNNTLLWEISGNGLNKPSYLFGSFHLMCPSDIHFSKELMQAMDNSAEVYFEMDLDDPSNTLGAMLFMNMKDGKTLRELYNDEEYTRLEKFLRDSAGISLGSMKKMKPSVLEAFLYPKLMPCKDLSGVEIKLLKLAQEKKKEVKGFETIAFQSSVFDSIPYTVQAKELLNSIDSFYEYKRSFNTLLDVYRNQQLDSIAYLINNSEFGMEENQDLLLDKRNRNWVNQLKKVLPEKPVFIAVGTAHLVGDKGLIALLRKEGFTLRPLKNK